MRGWTITAIIDVEFAVFAPESVVGQLSAHSGNSSSGWGR